jgi:hypothetical protein
MRFRNLAFATVALLTVPTALAKSERPATLPSELPLDRRDCPARRRQRCASRGWPQRNDRQLERAAFGIQGRDMSSGRHRSRYFPAADRRW